VKKILVTGGSGYIGSHVAKMLYENGYEPVVYDMQSRSRPWAHLNWEAVAGDITNKWSIGHIFDNHKFDAVIHLAAISTVERSITDPLPYYQTNVGGAAALVEACRWHGVNKIVFSSSSSVYGLSNYKPRLESDAKNPVTAYGASKLAAEYLFRDASSLGIQTVGLRYFNASGASPDAKIGEYRTAASHLIPSIQCVIEGKRSQLSIYGNEFNTVDNTAIKDFTHVWDIAASHLNALDYLFNGGKSDVFNIGAGDGKTVFQMFLEYQLQSDVKIPFVFGNTRPGDVECNYADISKAKHILGWEPKLSDKATIVRDARRWYSTELYKSL